MLLSKVRLGCAGLRFSLTCVIIRGGIQEIGAQHQSARFLRHLQAVRARPLVHPEHSEGRSLLGNDSCPSVRSIRLHAGSFSLQVSGVPRHALEYSDKPSDCSQVYAVLDFSCVLNVSDQTVAFVELRQGLPSGFYFSDITSAILLRLMAFHPCGAWTIRRADRASSWLRGWVSRLGFANSAFASLLTRQSAGGGISMGRRPVRSSPTCYSPCSWRSYDLRF
jgi:hypothetical protein